MPNITRKDIEAQVVELARTFRSMNWIRETEDVRVHAGSGTMGNAWGLDIRDNADGYVRAFPGIDMSGAYTKTQAYERIRAAANMARWAWLANANK